MAWYDRLKKTVSGFFKKSGITFSEFMREFMVNMGVVDPKTAYRKNTWVYACVRAISNGINGVPWYIRNESSQERVSKSNPWYRLFRNPNPMMVSSQLWKKHIILCETRGECFWLLYDANNNPIKPDTVPDSIWVYGPDRVKPWIDQNTRQFKGWKFQPNLQEEKYVYFQRWQALRFFDVDPDDDFASIAPTIPSETAINVQFKSMGFNEAFLDNGAKVDGVINLDRETYQALGDDGVEAMRERFSDRHGGFRKNGRIPVIAGGSFEAIGGGPKDMDFEKLYGSTREEIIAAFGVPEHQIGLTKNLNMATAQEENKLFYTGNLIPKMKYYATVINDKMLLGTGFEFVWDEHSIKALQESMDSKVTNASSMVSELGYSLNEVNKKLELGMDEVKEKWANTTVDVRAAKKVESDAQPPEPNGKPKPKPKKGIEDEAETKADERDYADEYYQDVVRPVEEQFHKKIVSYWLRLKKEQLDLWDAKFGKCAPTDVITKENESEYRESLFDSFKWDEKLKNESLPFHRQAFNNSIAYLRFEIDAFYEFKPGDPEVAALLAEKNSQITGVNDRFKEKLLQSLSDGVSAGETVPQLRERIVSDFTEKVNTAWTIARTETAQAANMIRNHAMDVEGLKKEWLTAADENVRHKHAGYGKLGPKEMDYQYAKGLRFPADPKCRDAGQVVNCRCFQKAVRRDDL